MKKLILLLFIPLVSFGQNQKTYVKSVSVDENELALSEQSSNIKTPLNADLSNYTHLLLVKVDLLEGFSSIGDYNKIESILNLSAFEIMNPWNVDKSKFRKNETFLKTRKNESYLYLYIVEVEGKGDDVNTSIVVRDWRNKIIYNASHINTGLNEILAPLIDY